MESLMGIPEDSNDDEMNSNYTFIRSMLKDFSGFEINIFNSEALYIVCYSQS